MHNGFDKREDIRRETIYSELSLVGSWSRNHHAFYGEALLYTSMGRMVSDRSTDDYGRSDGR